MNSKDYHAHLRKEVKKNYPAEMIEETTELVISLSNEQLLNNFEVNRLLTGKGEFDEEDVYLSMFLYGEILRRMEVTK
jgi:hypothetical protein